MSVITTSALVSVGIAVCYYVGVLVDNAKARKKEERKSRQPKEYVDTVFLYYPKQNGEKNVLK